MKKLYYLSLVIVLLVLVLQADFKSYTLATQDGEVTVFLKKASSSSQMSRGLMFINYLPSNHGMIFILEEAKEPLFWMKNTYISLDMVFLSQTGVVQAVVKAAEPLSETAIDPNVIASFIIELPSGSVNKLNINVGDQLILH